MYSLKITITEDIINDTMACTKADPELYHNCGIAVAIKKIFPFAMIGTNTLFFDKHDLGNTCHHPLSFDAKIFIQQFDNSHDPSERRKLIGKSFDLEIPDEVIQRINIDEVKSIIASTPHLELV